MNKLKVGDKFIILKWAGTIEDITLKKKLYILREIRVGRETYLVFLDDENYPRNFGFCEAYKKVNKVEIDLSHIKPYGIVRFYNDIEKDRVF